MTELQENYEAEMCVIGAILIDENSYDRVSEIVNADCFSLETTKRIFIAAGELKNDGVKIDPITIKSRFETHKWPIDNDTLFQYMDIMPSAVNDVEYAKQVKGQYVKRRLRDMGQRMIDDNVSSAEDLLADASRVVDKLTEGESTSRLATSYEMMSDFVHDVMDRDKGVLPYVPTGFPTLDKMLGGGLPVGGMIIIAARTGMGKTSLALNIADKIQGPVLFVSLEMTITQITAKRLAMKTGMPSDRLLTGRNFSDHEYEVMAYAETDLSKSQLVVNRRPNASVSDINIMARSISGLKCIVIDYLGLIHTNEKGSRYERITEISRSLKQLALSLNVPIVALAQINRQVEGAQDKRPSLAHLRDSGAIEQDADAVLLLYREDYYDKQIDTSTVEVNLAKNRHGRTGVMNMAATLGKCQFIDCGESE